MSAASAVDGSVLPDAAAAGGTKAAVGNGSAPRGDVTDDNEKMRSLMVAGTDPFLIMADLQGTGTARKELSRGIGRVNPSSGASSRITNALVEPLQSADEVVPS